MNPLERKERSIEILKNVKVPFIEWLPAIEDENEIEIRSGEEIAKRAIACLISIQVACDINKGDNIEESKAFFLEFLDKYDVKEELTDKEKKIIFGNPEEQDIINMIWKYEAYWTLIWALGLVEKLEYPSEICDCNFAVRAVADCEDFEDFMKNVKLRSIDEILNEADLIYRYNWACVNARINGESSPSNLDSGVVFERHWGVNWLIGKNTYNDEWDSISTDT